MILIPHDAGRVSKDLTFLILERSNVFLYQKQKNKISSQKKKKNEHVIFSPSDELSSGVLRAMNGPEESLAESKSEKLLAEISRIGRTLFVFMLKQEKKKKQTKKKKKKSISQIPRSVELRNDPVGNILQRSSPTLVSAKER